MVSEQYRLNAEYCLYEATQMPSVVLKRGLLHMAKAWLQLAERAELSQIPRSARPPGPNHLNDLEAELAAVCALINNRTLNS
jgi:hypothetical protein